MASAQVLKKQGHLEAGKKKLEEFRKKKAAEKAKKIASDGPVHASNTGSHEKQLSDSERVRPVNSDATATSAAFEAAIAEPSHTENRKVSVEPEILSGSRSNFLSDAIAERPTSEISLTRLSSEEVRDDDVSQFAKQSNIELDPPHKKETYRDLDNVSAGVSINQSISFQLPSESVDYTSWQYRNNGSYGNFPSISDTQQRDFSVTSFGSSHSSLANGFPENSGIGFPHEYGNHTSLSHEGSAPLTSAGTGARRSRPSFLDSINISRGPSASPPVSRPLNVDLFGSKVHPEDTLGSQVSQNLKSSSVASGNGLDLYKQVIDRNLETKQNEDFKELEQHIEDLTQEKFSLQRALETSQTLAESLAAENSTLTDNYNHQGSVVNQLRSDMEKLQQEIRANLMELEAVRAEYSNAQLECNAADERAKLLASEVIGLEEKALRLRSNELKLERQLEELQAEISSFKKKISVLEKDRQDLQSTIDALQEEKKVLHSKLRKASANGKLPEVTKSTTIKQDVSTSTEDLDANENLNTNLSASVFPGNDVYSLPVLHDNREFNLQDGSLVIPSDQLRVIENINTLISELALEKEELVQALSAESSQSSKLKELNKELTRKLEVQTQRLELLTAQSMVNDGVQARLPDSHITNDNTPYADEGDEVVERVLGWIMKLFPGGPSRRRTSKLL
ncbi:OLC1v1019456C1 [Oldenlandia corymbosa var. corymbosa]|uniref:OLC1v1019456C1 n=1 Tax=Oldenlandia corymbosa var. corymbosa TaxID=529605 RepID=A0AAV1EE43_OLDCO|nr:OLC1v1019456C1 [Oldenlandia corymbosa var. corymbosa]